MSRCLPFPPPEYVKNGLQGEALIKQLQILKEKVLSKKKKKERKRKRKHGCNGVEEVRKKKCKDDKEKHIYDRSTLSVELGNSTLSVELGQPVSVDGYSDNCKLGGTFGIEKSSTFPSQVMVTKTPNKRNSKYNNYQGGCLIGKDKGEFDPNENLEAESDMLETKLEWLFRPVLPPLQSVQTDFEDEKWWLPKKNNLSKSERTQAKHDSNGTIINQGIQPYAHYLADADIYALPYVVPF